MISLSHEFLFVLFVLFFSFSFLTQPPTPQHTGTQKFLPTKVRVLHSKGKDSSALIMGAFLKTISVTKKIRNDLLIQILCSREDVGHVLRVQLTLTPDPPYQPYAPLNIEWSHQVQLYIFLFLFFFLFFLHLIVYRSVFSHSSFLLLLPSFLHNHTVW